VRLILGEHFGETTERDADKSDRLWVQLLRAPARLYRTINSSLSLSLSLSLSIANSRRPSADR